MAEAGIGFCARLLDRTDRNVDRKHKRNEHGVPEFANARDTAAAASSKVVLTADHGNVEGIGIGKPNVGATADERGEHVHVFPDALLRSSVAAKYQESIEWPNIGLPDNYVALIAPPLRAFIGEGKRSNYRR